MGEHRISPERYRVSLCELILLLYFMGLSARCSVVSVDLYEIGLCGFEGL